MSYVLVQHRVGMDPVSNLSTAGVSVLRGHLRMPHLLERLSALLYSALEQKGRTYNDSSTCLHHLLVYDKALPLSLLESLANISEIGDFLGPAYILHSIGAVINKPSGAGYTHNWHTDTYEPSNRGLMLNVLVPLTQFTHDNGCTRIYPRGAETPVELPLDIGDVLLFDSSLLHCTGANQTMDDRNCITVTFIKSYLKPQFDYRRLYSEEEQESLSGTARQLLNCNNRMPVTLGEFYARTVSVKGM